MSNLQKSLIILQNLEPLSGEEVQLPFYKHTKDLKTGSEIPISGISVTSSTNLKHKGLYFLNFFPSVLRGACFQMWYDFCSTLHSIQELNLKL